MGPVVAVADVRGVWVLSDVRRRVVVFVSRAGAVAAAAVARVVRGRLRRGFRRERVRGCRRAGDHERAVRRVEARVDARAVRVGVDRSVEGAVADAGSKRERRVVADDDGGGTFYDISSRRSPYDRVGVVCVDP